MKHPENSAEYKGLTVNSGVENLPSVNPYATFRRRKPNLSADEYVEGILRGDMRLLSQAVTLVESNLASDQAIAQQVIERCLPYAGKAVRLGITGVPGAGKSTFINQVTNAQAKVGEYAFTTTRPQLGVVRHKGREFVVADIPGLIEVVAEGAGVGDRFLGHIERCRVLLHLVDANDRNVAESYRIVRDELEAYGGGLVDKPVVVALNKIDTLDDELIAALSAELEEASGAEVIPISGASGVGVDWVLDKLLEAIPTNESPVDDDGAEDEVQWSPL
jgi:small GTP-binding protein